MMLRKLIHSFWLLYIAEVLCVFLPIAAWGDVSLSVFPDPVLRKVMSRFDSGWLVRDSEWESHIEGKNDGILSNQELERITHLDLDIAVKYPDLGAYVKSIKGTEYLTALEYLKWSYTDLGSTTLDVSNNHKITNLYVYGAQLTHLNVSGCTALRVLECPDNNLTTLNVSGCAALETLKCCNNELTNLNVSGYSTLRDLNCSNNKLTTLNVSGCPSLERLDCHYNKLTGGLNVSGCTALTNLSCYLNELTELDVSGCITLRSLYCDNNKLTTLNVNSCTALEFLYCANNRLTEIDLTNNKALRLNGNSSYLLQKFAGTKIKMKKTPKGYEVNMRDYISHPENIEYVYDTKYYSQLLTYNKETGIAVFSGPIASLSYGYNTNFGDVLMPVTIMNPLNVAVLERSGAGSKYTDLPIRDMTDNSYLKGKKLTETDIYNLTYSSNGKFGFTADGNSRLILRIQTNKPGIVSFTFSEYIGTTLESLAHRIEGNSFIVETKVRDWDGDVEDIYQFSAVLIAPESFPGNKKFPFDKFKVYVKFTDEDGQVSEDDLELRIEAAPVVLIHGLRDEGANCFGVTKNTGIWHSLTAAGFRDIRIWNYDGSRGPTEILSGVGAANGLFTTLCEVFEKYFKRGIVCTRADLVCHSMGGLMARKFLEETGKEIPNGNNWSECSYKQGMVRRVITIATPHRGSPWADIMIKGSTNPALWPLRQILYGLMNLSSWKLGYFDKNSDSAFRDLMTTAPRDYGFPSNVPMYSIYGDVKDDVAMFSTLIGGAGTWLGKVKFSAPHLAIIMQIVSSGMEAASSLADTINDVVFSREGHDMLVSVSSAAGDFAGSEAGYKGWDYMHINICAQNIIGSKVVKLLKGTSDSFKIFGASARTASPVNVKAGNAGNEEEFKFIEALNLKIEPSVFTVSDNNSQTVNFTASVSDSTSYDVYCAVGAGDAYKLLKLSNVGGKGKKFSGQIIFTSQDAAIMNAFCFTHNPNDSEGKSIHVSNTVSILALSDVSRTNIVSLDFMGTSTAYTSVGSEVHAVLYAVDNDGRYYDVSSPLTGTKWTSTEYARVNENGCIEGLKEGNTTLKASFRGYSASINVKVSRASELDVSISGKLSGGAVKKSYSNTLKVVGGKSPYTWTLNSGKLPDGLKLNKTTGKISGTPTKAGKFTFKVKVTDANKVTATKSYTVTITTPSITGTLPDGILKSSYSGKLSASGGTSPYVWTLNSGDLPSGLTLNESTGELLGTPGKSGTYKFEVKVTDKNKAIATKSYTVTITAPSITGTLSNGVIKVPYSKTLKASGGIASYTWTISKGSLPSGLTLNKSKGTITGTPTKAGKYTFTVKVTDKNKATATKSYTVTITSPSISGTLSNGVIKVPYSKTLTASGGTSPYVWTLNSGDLPSGLTLNKSTGELLGTPGKSGTYKFEVKVTDKNKAIATKSYTIRITAPSISGTLSDGIIKASYSKTLKASGGTAPYTWTKSSGTLPTGLTLNESTGELSGTPSKAGKFTFKIKLTDKNKASVTKAYTVTITSPAISGTLKAGTVSKSYSGTLKASGGTSPYAWTVSKGNLPVGLTLNKSKGTITGTPKKAGKYSFTVKITDKNKATAMKTYTITVKAASSEAVKTYSGQYEELYEPESDDMNLNAEGEKLTSYEQNVTLNVKPESHTYFVTELYVMSDDVLSQGTGRDEDLVSVRANEPVRFILGTWPLEVSYEAVCIDDETHEEIEIHEGTFIIPAELVHDDFKVCVKAKTGEGEYKLESEELYISAEE